MAGQTFGDAQSTLQQLDLVTARFEVYSDTVPKGQVVDTSPAAGTIVSPQTVITVNVSQGRKTVAVPSVQGLSAADATAQLTQAGFKVGQTTKENSASAPADTVIRTDPAGTTQGYEGDTVNLVVSSGLVTVPDVTGQPIDAAQSTLTQLSLAVKVEQDMGCDAVQGNPVSSQSIAAGDAPQGAEITLRYCGRR